jgi:hypothetical protein
MTVVSAFNQSTVLLLDAAVAVKVTGDTPQEVCDAIVNVSVTGHVGVEHIAVNVPNTVDDVNVVPEERVNFVLPSGSTTVKPTSEVHEPRVPT